MIKGTWGSEVNKRVTKILNKNIKQDLGDFKYGDCT